MGSSVGVGLAVLRRALARSFPDCGGIYLEAHVLDHDQKAGCVEQPRHY